MQLTGEMLIGSAAVRGNGPELRAIDPSNGNKLDPSFAGGTKSDVERACTMAWSAFDAFRETSLEDRAKLLEAISRVCGDIPICLTIVGDGPTRAELERQFEGTATVFTGYLRGTELSSAYASADLFVLPSQTETLGLVLLEAMAAGCPVVACRAGGVPDAVEDGVTGFLFDPAKPGSFAATVRNAYNSNGQLDAIRENARREVEQRSWARATDDLRLLYCQVVHEKLAFGSKWRVRPPLPLPKRIAAEIARGTLRTLLP